MAIELLAALLLGGLVLWLVLQPLYRTGPAVPAFIEPEDPEETRKGIALIALKEIDFDRATGKLSDEDYEFLKARYTQEAVAAIREEAADPVEQLIAQRAAALRNGYPEEAPAGSLVCPSCGPRPEQDARFCSSCGSTLTAPGAPATCGSCRAPLAPGSRFCGGCGTRVAA